MEIFYKKWKKHNEIRLEKKQSDIKYSKNNESSTIPRPKYNINKHNMVLLYKIRKQYNEI